MKKNILKAAEILGCIRKDCDKCDFYNQSCFEYKHLMTMAKWKDEEYDECKKDILTLVNLIPCNEENESIINDIKNLLR